MNDRTQLYTVPEAADILDISHEAVRARLKRGTLIREDGEDGKVYVRLAAGLDDRNDRMDDRPGDQPDRPDRPDGQDNDQSIPPTVLLDALYDRIEDLKQQIERMNREAERRDTIMLHLTQGRDPPDLRGELPESRREPGPGKSEPPEPEPKETSKQISWWRRFFGY